MNDSSGADGQVDGQTGAQAATRRTRVHVGQPARMADRERFGLTGRSLSFDPRIVAIRPDLADITMAGTHFAPHYAAAMMRSCIAPRTPMRQEPDDSAPQVSELLYGEGFALLDITGGWAWGYALADHQVGYLNAAALGAPIAATHRVSMLETVMTSPDGTTTLPYGALLMGHAEGDLLRTAAGTVPADAVQELSGGMTDNAAIAAVAERFIGAPVKAGGRSGAGIDGAGLAQLAAATVGVALPRPADLQAAALADDVAPGQLQRGDLLFLGDEVAIVAGPDHAIAANAQSCRIEQIAMAELFASAANGGTALTGKRVRP